MSSLLHVSDTFLEALTWCNDQHDSEVGFQVSAQTIPGYEDEPHYIVLFHTEDMYMVRKEPGTNAWIIEEIKKVTRN